MSNEIKVTGNCGRADFAYTKSGKPMLKFSLADNSGKGDNQKVQWLNCIIFGDAAESFKDHIQKGTKVQAIGRLDVSEYEKRDGTKGINLTVWTDKVYVEADIPWERREQHNQQSDEIGL